MTKPLPHDTSKVLISRSKDARAHVFRNDSIAQRLCKIEGPSSARLQPTFRFVLCENTTVLRVQPRTR